MKRKLDNKTRKRARAALSEAADTVKATQATQAKMAEKVLRKAAEGDVSHEELKDTAIEAGKKPAP